MPRRRMILALVLAMLMIGATESTETDASTDNVLLTGENVIVYPLAQYVFSESHHELFVGTRTAAGGCSFSLSRETQPGQTISAIEVAYDPTTCRSEYVIGDLVSGAPESADDDGGSGSSGYRYEEDTAVGGDNGGVSTRNVNVRHEAYTWSWYDEPVRWVFQDANNTCKNPDEFCFLDSVNTLRNFLSWIPDGTCAIASGSLAFSGAISTWYKLTGWEEDAHAFSGFENVMPCDPAIHSRSFVHYRNDAFCDTILGLASLPTLLIDFQTDTWFLPNEVVGKANGSATHRWNVSKAGGCSDLLRQGLQLQNSHAGTFTPANFGSSGTA